MPLRVAFDVDGVLADFHAGFREAARAVVGASLEAGGEPEQFAVEQLPSRALRRVWRRILRTPNWWAKLPPYEPAQIRRLAALSRELKWEVVFVTRRPETAGEPVQFQTQWWLERQGFLLPAVVTVPGSRGELANALRLDLLVDDDLHNCLDVVSSSQAKALFVARGPVEDTTRRQTATHGIGIVGSLEEALDVLVGAHEVLVSQRGRLLRLLDWFRPSVPSTDRLPPPTRPLPPID
jgi:hypothetical protein